MTTSKTYSLSELSYAVRMTLEQTFTGRYWIRAEASEVRRNKASGHCYLELIEKSADGFIVAKMRAMIWATQYNEIAHRFQKETEQEIAVGLEMMMLVGITYHEQYGLSLVVHNIDPTYTLGAAARLRRETVRRLQKEELIDRNAALELARPLQRLAILSSPTAAGYEDFMHHIKDTPEGYQFYTHIYKATLQGEAAQASILKAFECISRHADRYDAIVVIRGGGSTSELSTFDSYPIAQAIALAPLPVLTGIGHERDESVADMVAARAFKTPTAVADFLVGRMRAESTLIEDFLRAVVEATNLLSANRHRDIELLPAKLQLAVDRMTRYEGERITMLSHALATESRRLLISDSRRLAEIATFLPLASRTSSNRERDRISPLVSRLEVAIRTYIHNQKGYIGAYEQVMRLSHPNNILKRGFVIARTPAGGFVRKAADLQADQEIELQFYDTKRRVRTLSKDEQS